MENVRISLENGETTLSVRHFRIEEATNGLFQVKIRAVSPNESLDLSTFVGHRATVSLAGTKERLYRGLVTQMILCRVSEENLAHELATYEFTIHPTAWRLTQRKGNRLFQHVSIPEIVTRILNELRIPHQWRIGTDQYPKLELRTQYGETDFAFVSRLLEEAGISFWFDDEGPDDCTLILGDAPQTGTPRAGMPIAFVDDTFQAQSGRREWVTKVTLREDSRPGRVTLRDYDFWRPRHPAFVEAFAKRPEEHPHEQFAFAPGAYLHEMGGPAKPSALSTASRLATAAAHLDPNVAMLATGLQAAATDTPVADDRAVARFRDDFGHHTARLMLEALHADRRVLTFETSVNDLSPGSVFRIAGHPRDDISRDVSFLVTSSVFEGDVGKPDEWRFAGASIDTRVAHRPARITPKPRIFGLQTAVVVAPHGAGSAETGQLLGAVTQAAAAIGRVPGAAGAAAGLGLDAAATAAQLVDNEIYVDEHGRVRVQFPWDREGRFDSHSSIWMRVSQGWAGGGYGLFTIPRVGHEVLVAFLDGDPDCPLVVGRVHNTVEPVPFKLPENKTVSTWKTSSSPGGMGFNELRFDDASGREHVYLQAQKDMDQLVKNDHKEAVGNNRSRYIQNDDATAVGHDRTKFVNHNEIEATGLNRSAFVGVNRTSTVGVEDSTNVGTRWSVTIARGTTRKLAKELERIAGSVGGVMRSAATGVLGGITGNPLANLLDGALTHFGRTAFSQLQTALDGLDGFETDPGPPPTAIEMVDRQIKLSTGEASIVLDGPNVTITAQGNIAFHAMGSISMMAENEALVAAREKVAVMSAMNDVIVQAQKDLHLNPYAGGGDMPDAERLDGDPVGELLRCDQCGSKLRETPEGWMCPQDAMAMMGEDAG